MLIRAVFLFSLSRDTPTTKKASASVESGALRTSSKEEGRGMASPSSEHAPDM